MNEVINLPLNAGDFGEYQGPFILNKPLTLTGQGEKTPLLAKGCPAVVILSPGVRLVNLEIADSFNPQSGVSLLIEERANPILENVKISGQKVIMSREHLIDLGDFLPQQQASSFIEVEVAGPAQIRCAENSKKWLQVNTNMLPAAGKYLLQILCDAKALGAEGIAAGNIEIITGAATRSMWVTAHVLAAPPPHMLSGTIALLLGKDQRIRFGESFLIGKGRFPGLQQAASMAEKQAILLKEAGSGGWVIYQPWQTPTPTLVNGQALAQGQRVLLEAGAIIRAGNLDLKAEAFSGAGNYAVNKALIDLGIPGQSPIDTGFQIRSQAGGKEKVKIFSAVPWVQVVPGEIELRKDEVRDIQVTVTPAARNLPPIKQRERSAILVQGKNETLSLDVDVEIRAETIIPRAAPDSIKLGTVSDWTKAQASVAIFNDGAKEWRPMLHASQDWLSVEPVNLMIAPGKSDHFTLRLNQKAERLPSPSEHKATVTLQGDGVQLALNVSVRLHLAKAEAPQTPPPPAEPRPKIRFMPANFGPVGDWTSAQITIPIYNDGDQEWTDVQVSSAVPWLDVAPGQISVPHNGKTELTARLNERLNTLPAGPHQADAIILSKGAIQLAVRVQLNLADSELQASEKEISFSLDDSTPLASIQASVVIENTGGKSWTGKIKTAAPWLRITPETATIAAKGSQRITIGIDETVHGLGTGNQKFGNMVVFENSSLALDVIVDIKKKPVISDMLEIEPEPLDFGKFEQAAKRPGLELSISGERDWQAGLATMDNWFRAAQNTVSGTAGKPVKVRIELTEHAASLPNDIHWGELLITAQNGRVYKIHVKLDKKVAPPPSGPLPAYDWSIQPEGITFGAVEKGPAWDAQAAEELAITNKGSQEINLSIKVIEGENWIEAPGITRVPPRAERKVNIHLKKGVSNYLPLGNKKGRIEISGAGKPVELIVTLQLTPKSQESTLGIGAAAAQTSAKPAAVEARLQIDPAQLVFTEPDPSRWKNVPAQKIDIHNPNSSGWSGTVKSEDWLSAPAALDIAPYGHASLEIRLKPSPFVKAGTTQEYDQADAVIIRRADESYSIRVIVGAAATQPFVPEPPAQVVARPPKPAQNEQPTPKSTLFGAKPSTAPVEQTMPPAISKPASSPFTRPSTPPQDEQHTPKTTLFGAKPPTGAAEDTAPQADAIEVYPQQVDFGAVTNWATAAQQQVQIRNRSNQAIQLSIATVDWLKPSEKQIECPANGSITIQVSLLKPGGVFAQIPKGLRSDGYGIIIQYGEHAKPITISVETV